MIFHFFWKNGKNLHHLLKVSLNVEVELVLHVVNAVIGILMEVTIGSVVMVLPAVLLMLVVVLVFVFIYAIANRITEESIFIITNAFIVHQHM